jgi:hypothetical protein
MTSDNFCFYLPNKLIQTSQTGGQWYCDTSPFSIPCSQIYELSWLTLSLSLSLSLCLSLSLSIYLSLSLSIVLLAHTISKHLFIKYSLSLSHAQTLLKHTQERVLLPPLSLHFTHSQDKGFSCVFQPLSPSRMKTIPADVNIIFKTLHFWCSAQIS